MRYVRVENNEVVEGPMILPINWKDISNFYVLDNVSLKSHGFYPHRFVETPLNDGQMYDGSYYVIEEDEVIERQTVRQKTEDQIQQEIAGRWDNIRVQRNILLSESDWTQLGDVSLSDVKKEEWRLYRQSLRDITNFDSPDHVIWPNKPE